MHVAYEVGVVPEWLMRPYSDVDIRAVRFAFDEQLRRGLKAGREQNVERDDRVVRIVTPDGGWCGVVWSDLLDSDADTVIAEQVHRFAELARPWEWKVYSYDQPSDLPARLAAAGFAPEPVETLLVADLAELVPPEPSAAAAGVECVPVVDKAGVEAMVRVHDEVFGGDHARIGRAVLAGLTAQPPPVQAVLAVAEGTAVAAGRVEFSEGTEFAGLWGGGTLPAWRGRGVFRSLVAYRAELARARGFRYLQVDATAQSRPILQRLGFVELATTTPYIHPGGR